MYSDYLKDVARHLKRKHISMARARRAIGDSTMHEWYRVGNMASRLADAIADEIKTHKIK